MPQRLFWNWIVCAENDGAIALEREIGRMELAKGVDQISLATIAALTIR